MEKVIICVDDEKSLLSALQQQLFREFSSEYLLEFAESAQEALDLIDEFVSLDTEISCVITDQMMPGMKGNELIEKIKKISPKTQCILLTGYAENIEDHKKSEQISACFYKPWEDRELVGEIHKLLSN